MPSLLLAPQLELQANNWGRLLLGAGPRGLSSAAPAPGWWGDVLVGAWGSAWCGSSLCVCVHPLSFLGIGDLILIPSGPGGLGSSAQVCQRMLMATAII